MLILNYAHPLTTVQHAQLAALVGAEPVVRDVATQIDQNQPLAAQVAALAEAAALSPTEWQTTPLIVNLPGLSSVAALLLAELHGRIGHFPALLRVRPKPGALTPEYEIAEVLNLQQQRETARTKRDRVD